MPMRVVISLFIALLAAGPVAAYDFKGDTVGLLKLSDFLAREKASNATDDLFCSDNKEMSRALAFKAVYGQVGIVHCARMKVVGGRIFDYSTIAGAEARIIYHFLDGTLYQISAQFDADRFSAVLDAMIEKYGKPVEVTQSTVQNKLGATFTSRDAIWHDLKKGIDIAARERTFLVDKSNVVFLHAKLFDVAEKRIREAEGKVKDL